nr:hypothetical protein [Coleofasciculus sp. FACHB-125]
MWNENSWRRKPEIQQMNLCIFEQGEKLWLYRVEDAILMVEVKPTANVSTDSGNQNIGQVVLKRLIDAEDVIQRMNESAALPQLSSTQESG